jgi:hypothetical protein
LFSQAALGPFAGLDAPVTATVSVGLDRHDGVNRFEGDVTIGRGNADMAGGRFNLAGGRLHGRYDIDSDQLIVDQMQLAGSRTRIRGEARLRDASRILRAAPNEPAAFDIAFPSMTLDVPGVFAAPLDFANVQFVGAIDSADRAINVTRIRAEAGEAVIEGAGRYYFGPVGADHALRPGLALDATVNGALTVQQVMQGWPMTLASGTHGYLLHTLRAGVVTDGRVHIDLRPADALGGPHRNDAINVSFNVANGEMQFLETMSPVTAARASGLLQGNSFHMTVPQARINGVALSNGRIEVTQFHPHEGQYVTISARAEGEARNIVEVLMQRPLDLHERIPVDPATVSGRGSVNIMLQRPMEKDVPFQDWRFRVDGQMQNFAASMSTRRVALANGQLRVRGDQQSIAVTGPIRAGTSNVQIAWTEYLQRRGRSSSEYQISGDFDAQDLVRLGYDAARYASGRVGVTVSGQGRGFDVDRAHLEINLTNAAVNSPWRFWTKPAGQAASAQLTINRTPDGGLAFNDIDGRGPGAVVQGNLRLARDSRIMELNLPRLAIQGRSSARVTASRGADGALDVAVRGALFDAAPFMEAGDDAQGGAGGGGTPDAVRVSVIVDALKMRGGATLGNANVALSATRGALATLIASGTSPGDRAFSLALGARADDPQGRIQFHADDAGFAVAALTGTPNVVGGTANAEGDWRAGPPSSARFRVHMRDFQVVRLPAMARLLSSAGSLTGLAETLNGEGIGFTVLDARLTFANNRVTFTDGRMTGPSLGLTGAGSYDIRADNLAVDGVVAPSPMLNLSLLGNIPVLGNLLVSRRGEGVIGMTYSINGHVATPRVFVNPVSALTPGILRRIFEPLAPRQPSATQDAPQQQQPQAPPASPEAANDNSATSSTTESSAPADAGGGASR